MLCSNVTAICNERAANLVYYYSLVTGMVAMTIKTAIDQLQTAICNVVVSCIVQICELD